MTQVTTYQHTCQRCGKVWNSLLEHPVACPKCKQEGWDTPRKRAYVPRPQHKPNRGSA